MSQVGDRVVGWEGKGGHVKHVKKIQAHLWKRKKKAVFKDYSDMHYHSKYRYITHETYI